MTHDDTTHVTIPSEEWKPKNGPLNRTHHRFEQCIKSCCTVKRLRQTFPITEWLPRYRWHYLKHDLMAGMTVGMTVIPQGIAYANVAGLPLQYGLYTSFMGCFVYCIFGTIRQIHIGPTAIMALLTADQTRKGGVTYALILTLLGGCLQILLGILQLGFLVDFIATPVTSAFASAAATMVIINQLKAFLGIKFKADSVPSVLSNLAINIEQTNFWDLGLGIICLITLLILRKIKPEKKPKDGSTEKMTYKKVFSVILSFLCTGRNALVVICAALVAYGLVSHNHFGITLTGDVQQGLPPFRPPDFTAEINNSTYNFLDICADLGSSIILVPLVSVLEHVAIAKSFAAGIPIDATQELTALGLCNILGSFVSSFPLTASFSRSALNSSSGVKTPLAGIFTGSLVLLALAVLAPYFKYIPRATLAAVIISAVVFMIEFEMIPRLWRNKRSDLVVWLTTYFCCIFFGAEYGILAGIGVSILLLLHYTARPQIKVERSCEVEYIRIQPDRGLFFPAAEFTRNKVNKVALASGGTPVVFDGAHMSGTDFTTAQGMKQLAEDFEKRNQKIVFTNLKYVIVDLIRSLKPGHFPHCQTTEEVEAMLKGDPTSKDDKENGSANFILAKTDVEITENHNSGDSDQPLLSRTPPSGTADTIEWQSKESLHSNSSKV